MSSKAIEIPQKTRSTKKPEITQKEKVLEEPNRIRGFLAGVVSGVTKLCVGHPFDTIKEGLRALYKGATPPLVGWAFMDSIMLGSFHNYRLLLQKNDPTVKLTVPQQALAGL
ncbi:11818_t:CDS:2, partial [Ambispora leptoticha]